MEIENLKFRVIPDSNVEDFLKADQEVWEPWLHNQNGFLRKTAALYPGGVVHFRLFWASKKDLDKAKKDPKIPIMDVRLKNRFAGVFQKLP